MVVPKYLLEDLQTIEFTHREPIQPLDIMADITKYLHAPDSVVYLESYFGNKFVVTVCGNDAVKRLKVNNYVTIASKKYEYNISEIKVKRIIINKVPASMTEDDINSFYKNLGKVLHSEMENNAKRRTYFCMLVEKERIPERVTIADHVFDVVSF